MTIAFCSHCGISVPVGEPLCGDCEEILTPDKPIADPLTHDEREYGPRLDGRVNWSVDDDPVDVCILCGFPSDDVVGRVFEQISKVRKPFLKWILEDRLGFMGGAIADDAMPDRFLNLALPVCNQHLDDPRVLCVEAEFDRSPGRPHSVTLVNVHQDFVAAVERHTHEKWANIADNIDGAD